MNQLLFFSAAVVRGPVILFMLSSQTNYFIHFRYYYLILIKR